MGGRTLFSLWLFLFRWTHACYMLSRHLLFKGWLGFLMGFSFECELRKFCFVVLRVVRLNLTFFLLFSSLIFSRRQECLGRRSETFKQRHTEKPHTGEVKTSTKYIMQNATHRQKLCLEIYVPLESVQWNFDETSRNVIEIIQNVSVTTVSSHNSIFKTSDSSFGHRQHKREWTAWTRRMMW